MKDNTQSIAKTIFLCLLLAILVSGAYTFYNAKGFSYLSSDPAACNNCHIMNDVYDDYLKAPHSLKIAGKERATCADCHLPHDFVSKWISKAESGLKHGYHFTFNLDELPTHLSASDKSKEIVQTNCVKCHFDFVENVLHTANVKSDTNPNCVSCHSSVGHKRGF